MTEQQRRAAIARIKSKAAEARSQLAASREDTEDMHGHPFDSPGVTVQPSELSLLVTPFWGQR